MVIIQIIALFKMSSFDIFNQSSLVFPLLLFISNNSNFAHKFYLCTLKIQYLAAIQLSMFSQLCRLQFRF